MNKRWWILFLTACILGAPAISSAHIGDNVFLAFEILDEDLPDIDLNDGSILDWEDVVGDPSVTATDFAAITGTDPYNPLDFDFRIWVGWNRTYKRIYVAMESVDDIFLNQYSGGDLNAGLEHDGAIQFMVDGDHSGGQYDFEDSDSLSLLANNHRAQRYISLALAPDGNRVGYLGAGADWVNMPPYANGGGVHFPGPFDSQIDYHNRSIIEFYITPFDCLVWDDPDTSVPSTFLINQIIGIDISLGDFDRTLGRSDTFFSLTGQSESWRFADQFADFILMEKLKGGRDCFFGPCGGSPAVPPIVCSHDSLFQSSPTVAPQASWARIKASFQD